MSKFPRYNNVDLLGMTKLAKIQDEQIWHNFLTPQVRALLGPIVHYGQPQVSELITGHFPGDEASNLNGHQLFDELGRPLVRFPYLTTMHKTLYGALVIKRDAVKLKVTAWVGDVLSGQGQMIHLVGLRDRRLDGTWRTNDSPLLDYYYNDPVFHQRLTSSVRCAEVSVYSFLPGSSIADSTGEPEFEQFIRTPYNFLDRPELFKQYFQRAWKTARAPGQHCAPVRDFSKTILPSVERLAAAAGYSFLECAVSHYHVALWFKANGYRYTFTEHARTMSEFAIGLQTLKDSGIKLARQQESWVCAVQSLRPQNLIPPELKLNGPEWPQNNIGPELLWMNKPLNAAAADLIKAPVSMHKTATEECL